MASGWSNLYVYERRSYPLSANGGFPLPHLQLLPPPGVRRRYLFAVGGYVVMPEHVHLLVSEPRRAQLSKAIQALKLSVSMRSRERPFWQAHYYDLNVSAHEKFVEELRYMHRNPVKRGLAAKPEDWKWSSFRHYSTGMRGAVEIESEWTARQRGWQLPDWMRVTSPVPKARDRGHPRYLKLNEISFGTGATRRMERPLVPLRFGLLWVKLLPFMVRFFPAFHLV